MADEYKIINRIYSELEDEESRYLFRNRKKYNDTGDWKYINNIIDKYVPKFTGRKYYPGKEEKLINLVKETKKDVIIFGAGVRGGRLLDLFEGVGIRVKCFCDSNCSKLGARMGGVPIISVREFEEKKLYDNYVIVISPMNHYDEIKETLLNCKCELSNIYTYADFTDLVLEEQYFDKDIIQFVDNEVFVDGGCYDFGSSKNLLKRMRELGKVCKKIYAFEPDGKNLEKCKSSILKVKASMQNVELVQAGLWSKDSFVEFEARGDSSSRITYSHGNQRNKINVVALDTYCKEKVTFIKMDIEGAELEALKGAQNIIKEDKPKLAISIYHRKEDLWQIPYYIKSLVPEYKLYIRHYSNNSNELVLYAVM